MKVYVDADYIATLEAINAQLLEACEKSLRMIDMIMAYADEMSIEVLTLAPVVGQQLEDIIAAAKGGE